MSRQGWYREIEEAIKACNEAIEESFRIKITGQANIDMNVVPARKVEVIKKILKNITITSMPF